MKQISPSDPFFSTYTCVERLHGWYEQHKNLIIAFDYDDTIYDFHNKGYDYPQVVELLQECTKLGFTLILFTSKETEKELAEIKNEIWDNHAIRVDYINKSPVMNTVKPYFNLLLDDKAGLGQAYDILDLTIAKIKKELPNEPAVV